MRRFSGPITIDRLINLFINLVIWRVMMRVVDLFINKAFAGIGGLFGKRKESPLLPPTTEDKPQPQLNDFSRPRD